MSLNDRAVKFALPRAKPYYLIDGSGLYLKVSPAGTKTWFYRRQGAQDAWKKLGRYPHMSLLQARNEAAVAAGRGFVIPTVLEAYRDYLPRIRQHYKWHGDIERRFEADILPALGGRRVDKVERKECSDLLQTIVARGSKVAANRTLPDVRNFFNYCVERGWTNVNPALGITRKSVGGKERPKARNLSEPELVTLIGELLKDRFHVRTRLALGLLLVTGTRAGEVLGIDRREVSGHLWQLPGERTKNGRLHKVYLSPQAKNLFTAAFRYFGPNPFKGMDHRTLSRATARLRFNPPFSPHKFRHTMATRLTDLGVAPHIVEKMLNHKLEGVFEVYNHAEFLSERRAAWRLWGAYLAKLRRGYEKTGPIRRSVVRVDRPGDADNALHLRARSTTDSGGSASGRPGRALPGHKAAF